MNLKYGEECYKCDNKFSIGIIQIIGLICSQKDLGLGSVKLGLKRQRSTIMICLRTE